LGIVIVGNPSKQLKKMLGEFDVNMKRDCYIVSPLKAKAAKYDTKHLVYCQGHLFQTLTGLKPKLVILLGNDGIQSFMGANGRWGKEVGSILRWRGWTIPDHEYKCVVCPVFDPVAIETDYRTNPAAEKILYADLETALNQLDAYAPVKFKKPKLLYKREEVTKVLQKIQRNMSTFAWDIEGTGLKPHRKGHKIRTVAIATKDNCWAFPTTALDLQLWKRILGDANISKIAHNMKFEHNWARGIWGVEVKGWLHDTMLCAHCVDTRSKTAGLKFQSYVQYGVRDYSSGMEQYWASIDPDDESANAINKVYEAPLDELLYYNALDAQYTYQLYLDQAHKIPKGYQLLHDGTLMLADIETNGIPVDIEYTKKQLNHLERTIKLDEKLLKESEGGKIWDQLYGVSYKEKKRIIKTPYEHTFKNGRTVTRYHKETVMEQIEVPSKVNYDSSTQIRKVIFGELGVKPRLLTATGLPKTDEEALEEIDEPFVSRLMKIRKLKKAKNTYLKNILNETVDGIMHPFFSTVTTRTLRSSSSNPNLQNQPNRNPMMGRIVRRCYKMPDDYHLVEIDYSGIEVQFAACYHKDPTMLKYLSDPESDMHSDMAEQIFMLPKAHITKGIRHCAKNRFVFPIFYGSYWKSIASNIWYALGQLEHEGKPLQAHLATKGIHYLNCKCPKNDRGYSNGPCVCKSFEGHIQRVEDHFWNVRFAKFSKWKKQRWNQYLKDLKHTSKAGFEFCGFFTRNEVTNYAVQGSAFICGILYSMVHLHRWLKSHQMRTKLMGQVHDSVVAMVHKDELDVFLKMANQIMCHDAPREFPWIITKLESDVEITHLGGTWFDKMEYAKWVAMVEDWNYMDQLGSVSSNQDPKQLTESELLAALTLQVKLVDSSDPQVQEIQQRIDTKYNNLH